MSVNIVPFSSHSNNNKNHILDKVHSLLPCQLVGQRAIKTGCVEHRAKLNPNKLLESMLCVVGEEEDLKFHSIVSVSNLICKTNEQIIEYKTLHNRLRKPEMIKFALDLLCLIQERTLDCKYGGNKEVKALIESLNDCNLLIDDIYLHDGCYWKINSKLADVFPGTWSNQKEIGECDTYDTNGEQVKVSPGNAEIGITIERPSCKST